MREAITGLKMRLRPSPERCRDAAPEAQARGRFTVVRSAAVAAGALPGPDFPTNLLPETQGTDFYPKPQLQLVGFRSWGFGGSGDRPWGAGGRPGGPGSPLLPARLPGASALGRALLQNEFFGHFRIPLPHEGSPDRLGKVWIPSPLSSPRSRSCSKTKSPISVSASQCRNFPFLSETYLPWEMASVAEGLVALLGGRGSGDNLCFGGEIPWPCPTFRGEAPSLPAFTPEPRCG